MALLKLLKVDLCFQLETLSAEGGKKKKKAPFANSL